MEVAMARGNNLHFSEQHIIIENIYLGLGIPVNATNECTWSSITCMDGLVTSLQISSSHFCCGMSATISTHIGSLPNLKSIFLCKFLSYDTNMHG